MNSIKIRIQKWPGNVGYDFKNIADLSSYRGSMISGWFSTPKRNDIRSNNNEFLSTMRTNQDISLLWKEISSMKEQISDLKKDRDECKVENYKLKEEN